jgi:3-oxoacyl-[acyl-carrier protein] reductase
VWETREVNASKIAVVTGGGSGIGRQTARRLLGDGWRVWVLDANASIEGRPSHSSDAEGQLRTLRCDVSDLDDLRRAFDRIGAAAGALDALVCSAGVIRTGELESTSLADAELMLNVNLKGTWLTIREAIPLLRANARQDDPARVVVVGSISGIRPKVSSGLYGASKAAMHVVAQVYAVELAASGITVNAVAPGPTDTPMNAAALGEGTATGFRTSGPSPLGRIAQPDDVANAIMFLLSKEAAYINGVVLPVDGGIRAAIANR